MYLANLRRSSIVPLILAIFYGISTVPNATSADRTSRLPFQVIPAFGANSSSPMSVTADGRFAAILAATGGELWNLVKGHKLRNFHELSSLSEAIAISPDGQYVAAIVNGDSGVASLIVWNSITGEKVQKLRLTFMPQALSFTPSSEDIVLVGYAFEIGSPSFAIYRAGTGENLVSKNIGHNSSLDISPNGKTIVVGGNAQVRVMDLRGTTLVKHNAHRFKSQNGYASVTRVRFSPSGKYFATVGGDRKINIWDMSTKRIVKTFTNVGKKEFGTKVLSWSKDDRFLASTGSASHILKIWDVETGQIIAQKHFMAKEGRNKSRFPSEIGDVIFDRVGETLLLSALGLRRVAFANLEEISELGVSHYAEIISPAPSNMPGVYFVAMDDEETNLYTIDTTKGTVKATARLTSSGAFLATAASKNGNRISGIFGELDRNGNIRREIGIVDVIGKPALSKIEHEFPEFASKTAISPSGDIVAVPARGGVALLESETGRLVRKLKSGDIWSIAFSPDGKSLALSTYDALLFWRDWRRGPARKFTSKNRGFASFVSFDRKGNFFFESGGSPGIRLNQWTGDGRRLFRQLRVPRAGSIVQAMDFHPTQDFALVGSFDGTVRMWNIGSGEVVRSFDGFTSPVLGLAFSAQGKRVVAGSAGEIKISDSDTGELLLTLAVDGKVGWIAITPEGFFSASNPSVASVMAIVKGLESTAAGQLYQTLYNPDLVSEKLAGDPDDVVRGAAKHLGINAILSSGASPEIDLNVVSKVGTSGDLVVVETEVADSGGGIGRIEWRVNGLTVGIDSPKARGGSPLLIRRELPLDPGENAIEVIAYNGRNLISSLPAKATVTWNGTRDESAKPRLFVVAFGVKGYDPAKTFFKPLKYPVSDAVKLGQALSSAGVEDYGSVEVVYLLDDGSMPTDLQGGNSDVRPATADSLKRTLEELGAKMHPRDTFIFFASGHGFQNYKVVDGRFFLVPHGFSTIEMSQGKQLDDIFLETAIGQDKLQSWIANNIKAKRGLILLDACNSGASVAVRAIKPDDTLGAAQTLGRLHEATGRPVITASAALQDALDGYKGHGVFAYALLDGLANGDENGNGKIEVRELADHIQNLVPKISATVKVPGRTDPLRQKPKTGTRGEDFAIVNKKEPLIGAVAQ